MPPIEETLLKDTAVSDLVGELRNQPSDVQSPADDFPESLPAAPNQATRTQNERSVKVRRVEKLEMLRGFAALYVMVYHFTMLETKNWGIFSLPLRLGAEAVMIFFLISGFVVCLSFSNRPTDFKTYFLKRAVRIYPIYLMALGFGMITLYQQKQPLALGELMGNIAMLQDASFAKPGTWFSSYAEIHTLWSLAYEWWFYMLFYPVWRFVPAPRRMLAATGISAIGLLSFAIVPNQVGFYLMYFVLWWTGVELGVEYHATGRVTWLKQRQTLLVLGIYIFVGSCVILLVPLPRHVGMGQFPIVVVR
ncbi:MAG: acyltransferase, partial [Verrucomicrobiaceae bacterium]